MRGTRAAFEEMAKQSLVRSSSLRALLLAFLVAGIACTRRPDSLFTDVTERSGIDFRLSTGAAGERFVQETMIGGVGWIDYDGDGDPDLFCVNGHADALNPDAPGKESDRLYRNEGSGRFTDVTREAGVGDDRYGCGCAVGDYDNDGDADLLVTNFGRNLLWRNGGGTFEDATEAAGLREEGWSSSAAWFDMDRDGDLDLYVARYLKYHPRSSRRCQERGITVSCSPKFFPGEEDLLYLNLGGGSFREIGRQAGIARAGEREGKGLGVVAADFDRDGFTDVYVANDTTPNFLWRNQGDGTFVDVAQSGGSALSAEGEPQAGMGVDAGDVNGDRVLDLYITNFAFELNALYLGQGNAAFAESALKSNLGGTYVPLGFGTLFLDVDLDGDPDIVTLNGHVNEVVEATEPGSGSTYAQRPSLFLNGGSGVFADGAGRGGDFFSRPGVGRGLASSDFDGDGDLDLAAMTLDRSVVLLRNENPAGHSSFTLRLVGTRSPRDGYGAWVEVEAAGKTQGFLYQSARSYLSAVDPRLVVGLGKAPRADRVQAIWPSGQVQELRDVEAGAVVTLREP
jgi:hypothetical protein